MSHFSYVNDKLPKEQPSRFIIQILLWPALYIIACILLPLTLGLALMSHEKKRINISKPRARVAYNAALLGVGLLITPVWANGMMGTESADPEPKPATEQVQEVKQEEPEPVVEVKTETQEEKIKYATKKQKDNTLAKGVEYTKQEGKNGLKIYTYKVTYTDGVETGRKLVSEKVTQKPVSRIVVTGTKVAVAETPSPPSPPPPTNNCDENYSGACVPIASDVDCAGGSGNGPAYVRGPVYVEGTDIYRLDGDGDGVACE